MHLAGPGVGTVLVGDNDLVWPGGHDRRHVVLEGAQLRRRIGGLAADALIPTQRIDCPKLSLAPSESMTRGRWGHGPRLREPAAGGELTRILIQPQSRSMSTRR